MIIDNQEPENEDVTMTDVGGAAYKESITSVDGFTRGPNGRIKFNKDTKKRRREMDLIEDEVMADGDSAVVKPNKNDRKTDVKLGHVFKAKVRSCCTFSLILHFTSFFDRGQGEILKRKVWILTHICRCRKPPRKALGESVFRLALLESVDLCSTQYSR